MWKKNKLLFGLVIAGFLIIIWTIVTSTNTLASWQLRLANKLYGQDQPSKDIVIVAIDDKSVAPENGLGRYENWDRSYFAQVVNNINKYQPKVIVFDIFFRDPKNLESDKKLQEALSKVTNVVLFSFGSVIDSQKHDGYYYSSQFEAPSALFRSLPSVNLGLGLLLRDSDNLARHLLPGTFDKDSNTFYETIAFATVRSAFGIKKDVIQPSIHGNFYEMSLDTDRKIDIPLENGQMLINYFSSSFENSKSFYPKESFIDVYNENYSSNPVEKFKDKIVLIGGTFKDSKDFFPTPTSLQTPMPGVEIHANAIQTILEQKFLRNMTFPEKAGLIAFLAIAGTFIFMFTKIRWSVLFLAGTSIGYSLLAPFAFQKGLILDLIHPYLVLITAFMACYMYRYVTEFREKTALRTAFSKYVNPQLVEQILAHPEQLKLGGEKRNVTVLFTDIVHFTNLSEGLKPESLVALLNEYFQAMSEVILKQGGTLDKFEGDAIMAFFGAPLNQPDHALRATKVALNMRKRLHILLQKWQNDTPLPGGEKKPMIDFRCGISSGDAIVGNIGSSERFDYTAMGDMVNLGSRLEGANKKYGTHIMVSEATYIQVKDFFEARELDVIRVVGKNQSIKVYEIIAEKGQIPAEATTLLQLYAQGIQLYHGRHFGEAVDKFKQILQKYPQDAPSQLYMQRCEVLRDYPPKPDWDGVFEMGSK